MFSLISGQWHIWQNTQGRVLISDEKNKLPLFGTSKELAP